LIGEKIENSRLEDHADHRLELGIRINNEDIVLHCELGYTVQSLVLQDCLKTKLC